MNRELIDSTITSRDYVATSDSSSSILHTTTTTKCSLLVGVTTIEDNSSSHNTTATILSDSSTTSGDCIILPATITSTANTSNTKKTTTTTTTTESQSVVNKPKSITNRSSSSTKSPIVLIGSSSRSSSKKKMEAGDGNYDEEDAKVEAERRRQRRRARRRKTSNRKMKKKANRDMLVSLISQELADSWREEEGEETLVTDEVPEGLTAADIFYAQMNGEALTSSSMTLLPSSSTHSNDSFPSSSTAGRHRRGNKKKGEDGLDNYNSSTHTGTLLGSFEGEEDYNDEDEEDDFPEHTSFAGLVLPDAFLAHRKEQENDDTQRAVRSFGKNDLDLSRRSTDSGSSSGSSDTLLSVEEIKNTVYSSMPDEIKEKIPKDAWGRIFDGLAVDKTRRPSFSSLTVPDAELDDGEKEIINNNDDNDDSSVVSDITEFTSKGVQRPLQQEEECPAPKDCKPLTFRTITTSKSQKQLVVEDYDEEEDAKPSSFRTSYTQDTTLYQPTITSNTTSNTKGGESSGSNNSSSTRRVKFTTVQVRYYERVLDVNPAVTSGPAVGIGWRYKRGGMISVNNWEVRGIVGDTSSMRRRRGVDDLVMPRRFRESLLKEWGYTQVDMAQATRIIRVIKQNRKVTVQNLPNQHMEEAVENAARRVKGLLSFGRMKGLVSKQSSSSSYHHRR